MTISIAQIDKDLAYLTQRSKGSQRSRKNNFGVILDITHNGIPLQRSGTRNGFFFKLPMEPPFNVNDYSDLHLSIFDDTGVIRKHVSFKPNGPSTTPAYSWGDYLKHGKWVKGPFSRPYHARFPKGIIPALKHLYDNVKNYIVIQKRRSSGIVLTPKVLNTHGTASERILTSAQRQAARAHYQELGVAPPSTLLKSVKTKFRHDMTPKKLTF